MQEQGVILVCHHTSIIDEVDLSPINSQLEPNQQVQIKILRDGQSLELKSDPIRARDVIAYLIPELLITPEKADQLRVWLCSR
jgi:hypothetical protein